MEKATLSMSRRLDLGQSVREDHMTGLAVGRGNQERSDYRGHRHGM